MCAGSVSLAPTDRVELLSVLARDTDAMIAERAGSALLSQPPEVVLAVAAREDPAHPCPWQLFEYCARNLGDHPGMADALARNSQCPPTLLIPLAHRLNFSAIAALMDDLERLTAASGLASALLASPSLTSDQRSQLNELIETRDDTTALELAVAECEPDRGKRTTLLQRLMKMHVVDRVQLALKGGREERMALIRDPCKVVQRAVLQSPRISTGEIEAFAAMASLTEEILRLIGISRKYRKNYVVTKNLLNNPKAPLDVTLHLLPIMKQQDLKTLCLNKNIPDTLRMTALKLQRQRQASSSGH